jgi:hypothetical protein
MVKEPQFLKVPFGRIRPWGKNPRGIKTEDLEALAKSIREKGQFQVLTCWKEGGIYETGGGNMRWHAMKDVLHYADDKPIWISLNFPRTEAEKIELSILDNMKFGFYQDQQLAELLQPHLEEIDLESFRVDLGQGIDLKHLIERFGPSEEEPGAESGAKKNLVACPKCGFEFEAKKSKPVAE